MPKIHLRAEVWPGELPKSMSGALRPLLRPNRPFLTVHHGGAGRFLDEGDTVAELRSVQAFASSPGKATPWEYNWVVDGAGEIWEYAGGYQAAHSAGVRMVDGKRVAYNHNPDAIGVLLLMNSEVEHPTREMIDAVRWLRNYLVETGALARTHEMRQHRQMPGAATGCPGKFVVEVWDEFTVPWGAPAPAPAPAPTPPPPAPAPEPPAPAPAPTPSPVFPPPTGGQPMFVIVANQDPASAGRYLWDGMHIRPLQHPADVARVTLLFGTRYTIDQPFRLPQADIDFLLANG